MENLNKNNNTHKFVGMVDISSKPIVYRSVKAEGVIRLSKKTLSALRRGKVKKGDALATAEVAGILATKKTHELIPLCHPIPITRVQFTFEFIDDGIKVNCTVKADYRTGVEMEALVGVSMALLTIWDMVKYMEKDEEGQYPITAIECIKVVKKVKVK